MFASNTMPLSSHITLCSRQALACKKVPRRYWLADALITMDGVVGVISVELLVTPPPAVKHSRCKFGAEQPFASAAALTVRSAAAR